MGTSSLATRISSLEKFWQIPANQLRQLASDDLSQRFAKFANLMMRLLEQVETSTSSAAVSESDSNEAAIAKLKRIVVGRTVRNRIFGQDLFADPAWDMMLDLAIAMAENRRISISSLCIAANVPTTTALRHIKAMKDDGYLIIVGDPEDGRRKHVMLSENAYEMMIKFAVTNKGCTSRV